MRTFTDRYGNEWAARVLEEPGTDYKGRYYLAFSPTDSDELYPVEDVRWNSERTAGRTIETMSLFELRRRLKVALGRGPMRTTPAA